MPTRLLPKSGTWSVFSPCPIPDHLVRPTFWLPIESTTKCLLTVRGSNFGGDMESAAGASPASSAQATSKAKPHFCSCRRLAKNYLLDRFCQHPTATSHLDSLAISPTALKTDCSVNPCAKQHYLRRVFGQNPTTRVLQATKEVRLGVMEITVMFGAGRKLSFAWSEKPGSSQMHKL
jgi:hypothetical protein